MANNRRICLIASCPGKGQQEIVLSGNTVGNRIFCICALSFLVLVFPAAGNSVADSKADILREKIEQILSLREQISKKQMQAIEIRENLKEQVSKLRAEMIDDQKLLRIMSYEEAAHSPRIYYDLMLVLQLRAYISKLDEKIEALESGNAKLGFLYLQADDDLMIVETLNHMTIEKLLAQIDKALREYISMNDEYLIHTDDTVLEKPVEIWNEIIQQK